ncbi:hypothetical protein D2M30_1921 [Bacillus amyloliquefaciens]|nr:hypothetical protein D2M30_1921 [Bacillus amyloliquefaciens]
MLKGIWSRTKNLMNKRITARGYFLPSASGAYIKRKRCL